MSTSWTSLKEGGFCEFLNQRKAKKESEGQNLSGRLGRLPIAFLQHQRGDVQWLNNGKACLKEPAQELKGHLTLDRVTANRGGDEITVYFSADVLVEERPFLSMQRALRRNFAPMRVKLIIRSPELGQDFLTDPQKYAPFIMRCVKRPSPSRRAVSRRSDAGVQGRCADGAWCRRISRRGS